MLNRPTTRPRMSSGAFNCTRACAMVLNDSSKKPAANSNAIASDRSRRRRNASSDRLHRSARTMASAEPAEPSPRFERDARKQRAGGVGGQQHAVGHAGVAMPEIAGKARHLGVVGVADQEGGQPGEQRHRGQHPLRADVADGLHDVGKAADRRCAGARRPWRGSAPRTARAASADRTAC